MSGSIVGWVILGIVMFVLLIVGGIVLPMIVPMMRGYTQSSQSTITTGTPFFQFMADWWPVILPFVIIVAVIVLLFASRGGMGRGGGSV